MAHSYSARHVTKEHVMHSKWRCSDWHALAGHFLRYALLVPNKVAVECTCALQHFCEVLRDAVLETLCYFSRCCLPLCPILTFNP